MVKSENKAIAAEEEKAYERFLNDVSIVIKASKTIEGVLHSTSPIKHKKRKPMKK